MAQQVDEAVFFLDEAAAQGPLQAFDADILQQEGVEVGECVFVEVVEGPAVGPGCQAVQGSP
ncbi:hypothetical protein ACGFS9_31850 [Streptomyces sp. NPDC048566]|uniref:hypothetical protein n=1 Tax=Streptomyces sp. NPDC048566 TaxID=3365569 RepID=UPI003718D1D0